MNNKKKKISSLNPSISKEKLYSIFFIKTLEKYSILLISKFLSKIKIFTTLRTANGISKTGYIHPKTNIRYDVDYEFEEEISPYEDMPDNLRKSQCAWYKREYKQY